MEQLRREGDIVRGRIVDASGAPVAGANVVLAGTTVGAVSDPAGAFWFRLPNGHPDDGTVHASHVSFAGTKVVFE